jgi:hypothetical protein
MRPDMLTAALVAWFVLLVFVVALCRIAADPGPVQDAPARSRSASRRRRKRDAQAQEPVLVGHRAEVSDLAQRRDPPPYTDLERD